MVGGGCRRETYSSTFFSDGGSLARGNLGRLSLGSAFESVSLSAPDVNPDVETADDTSPVDARPDSRLLPGYDGCGVYST